MTRIVVVTGATGALGRAVLARFTSAGDALIGIARANADVSADLTRPEGAARAVAEIVAAHGRIDVLAHVMGGFAGGEPVVHTTVETWRHMLDLNLNAAFYIIRAVLPHMIRAGRGRIVAVGSRTGTQPGAGLSAYGVSKAGLNALVQTVAAEVRDLGITANVILPSVIDTEANRAWGKPDDVARWVKPEAVAELVFWLASQAAADVNDALIPVYGRA
ncbi:MAG: SDR family NAD(P)-dependent oxidoreductase [Acidobacteria bacterium]|nr:SDR family NAD(P)-dependent oxidoreductase [Acidobacteriota bacterium]